jgi:hypothetical protein
MTSLESSLPRTSSPTPTMYHTIDEARAAFLEGLSQSFLRVFRSPSIRTAHEHVVEKLSVGVVKEAFLGSFGCSNDVEKDQLREKFDVQRFDPEVREMFEAMVEGVRQPLGGLLNGAVQGTSFNETIILVGNPLLQDLKQFQKELKTSESLLNHGEQLYRYKLLQETLATTIENLEGLLNVLDDACWKYSRLEPNASLSTPDGARAVLRFAYSDKAEFERNLTHLFSMIIRTGKTCRMAEDLLPGKIGLGITSHPDLITPFADSLHTLFEALVGGKVSADFSEPAEEALHGFYAPFITLVASEVFSDS